ncbi:TniB family NTP-binding protein [Fluviispira vulneris]|uniref:TniB family NTP-binding protein n=1 Tax=Fluviispira vulneris TaxID=2763012 RepID=UPI0016483E7E|nr:TniB family NTP-binding protein [Fluviispira vulneris]
MIEVNFNNAFSLEHLIPQMRKIVLLPNEERIAHIRADRWIGYSKAQEAISKLQKLIDHPKRQRMPNLLIVSPTNNGKSMIIEKFKRMHKIISCENIPKEIIPIVALQMPSDPTIARFYSMLLYNLGAPVTMKCKVADLEHVALKLLKQLSTRMIIIDELHNILAGRINVQREFLNLIRFIGNELQIPIVCLGIREAYLAIRTDDQLENRFEPHILPLWEDDREFSSLLMSVTSTLPLKLPSFLLEKEIRQYILRKTEATIGEIISLISRTAILAIESGQENIDLKLLMQADYDSPTERRNKFERELQ